jgi:hypothetical protein
MGILDFFKGVTGKRLHLPETYGRQLKPYDQKVVEERWARLTEMVRGGKPSQWRQAVIEADKILDYALTQLCAGSTLGERLKAASSLFTSGVYQGLWDAHKIRNVLVHDASYEMSILSCREAVEKIKEGLKELGARL